MLLLVCTHDDGTEPHSAKFKGAERALECDDEPERFRERVAKLAGHNLVEKPEI